MQFLLPLLLLFLCVGINKAKAQLDFIAKPDYTISYVGFWSSAPLYEIRDTSAPGAPTSGLNSIFKINTNLFQVRTLRTGLAIGAMLPGTLIGSNDSGLLIPFKKDSLKINWTTQVTGKPSIPAGQVNADWNSVSGVSQILNKPTLATVATTGSYTDLTNKPTITTYTAGTGISIVAGAINNTAPDQTVVLTGSNGITTSGTYPNFTIARTKRQETYSGTTNGSGVYTVTFSNAYSVAPNIQANIIGGTNTNLIKITSISTTAFTVTVVNRVDVLGLLPTYANVSGAAVDVLITEK